MVDRAVLNLNARRSTGGTRTPGSCFGSIIFASYCLAVLISILRRGCAHFTPGRDGIPNTKPQLAL